MSDRTRRGPERRSRVAVLLALLGMAAVAGCGSDKPPLGTVQGRMTLDGKPISAGQVVFDRSEEGIVMTGNLNENGEFTLRSIHGDGLPVGEYAVSYSSSTTMKSDTPIPRADAARAAPKPKAPNVPKKYMNKETSGLKATVNEGDNPPFEFALTDE